MHVPRAFFSGPVRVGAVNSEDGIDARVGVLRCFFLLPSLSQLITFIRTNTPLSILSFQLSTSLVYDRAQMSLAQNA